MAITAHYIDNSWNLRSHLLRFVYAPCPHTSVALSSMLVDCLMSWNLDGKLCTITLDNCSTNDLMIEYVKDKLQPSKLVCSGAFLHMRCCAHIINLIVKDGLEIIKDGIERIRESVVFWTATPKRLEKFTQDAKQLSIDVTKKLILDCPTRWNSTYLMLLTAILYKDCFERLKLRDSKYKVVPNEADWQFAKEMCERLKMFHVVTELISGTRYPTINLFYSKLCDIKSTLTQWCASFDKMVSRMAEKILEKYN